MVRLRNLVKRQPRRYSLVSPSIHTSQIDGSRGGGRLLG